jgi:IMP dehydrogenase
MVVNPLTIHPDTTAGRSAATIKARTASPASRWSSADSGRLVGILTNRDVRFAEPIRRPRSTT